MATTSQWRHRIPPAWPPNISQNIGVMIPRSTTRNRRILQAVLSRQKHHQVITRICMTASTNTQRPGVDFMTVPNPTMVHILKIATAALGSLWNTASVNSALSNLRYMSIMVVAIPISRAYSIGIIFSPALFFRFIAITVTSMGIKDIRGLGRLPLFSSLSSSWT